MMMHKKEVILTNEGYKKLEEELKHLKTVKRKDVATSIKHALAFGDLSENSEYEEAKNEQAFIEGRIATLEKMLRNAKIIDDEKVSTETVSIGSKVKLKDLDMEDEFEFTIVGSVEADPRNNKISNESPVGKALLGKKVHSIVNIEVPAGVLRYKILEIKNR